MLITLKNDNTLAKINSFGAELKSLFIDENEIMWCSDPEFWGKSSPILFPAIGNVRNNKTIINGKEYSLKKHGFARDSEFSAEQLSSNSAVFTLKSTSATKENYPFDFTLEITYTLLKNSLEIDYNVVNKSDSEMPFCIGTHPAISCENLNESKLIFSQKETASTPVMNLETRLFQSKNRIKRLENNDTLQLSHKMFDNDVVYFDSIKSNSVRLVSPNHRDVSIDFSGFNSLGLWTPANMNAPFICIEAWCGSDDYDTDDSVFEHKKDIQLAKPYESKHYNIKISLC